METINLLKDKLNIFEFRSFQKPFNILNIMYHEILRKEELQSKILGGFLDPNENHGFGDVPFKLFLSLVFSETEFEISPTSKVFVFLERSVTPPNSPKRRIDILLSWKDSCNKDHAIIIENKLNWAPNQTNQLNDYYDCLVSEGYEVDGVVYLPFSSDYQKSIHTDAKDYVLAKTKDFDAEQLVDWLAKIIDYFKAKDSEIDLSSIIQYKDFFQCLISKNLEKMEALKIIEQLSIEEINKIEVLAKLVATETWCEARFRNISTKIQNSFEEELKISYKKWSDGHNYVQYYFEPCEFWIELWLYEKGIKLYIASEVFDRDSIQIGNRTFSNKEWDRNYYYHNDSYFIFDYNDVDKLVSITISILEELKKL